jgi:AcrR family transcriptional regulator
MQHDRSVKRAYRSPRRVEQARATRRAIVEAALRLFVARGYVATSVDAIAEAAGVSRATVFGVFGSKAALLKAAYDVALVGDDEPVALPDRPASRAVRSEPDAGPMLDGYAAILRDVHGRLAPIYEAVRGAASADPEVRAVWERIGEERRIGAEHVVADVIARGAMRPDLDPVAAADVTWVLNDPGIYHLLVHRRGWPPDRFEAWLAGALRRELLVPA